MPCISGSSKHKPCVQNKCVDKEVCPCTIQPAFSCGQAYDKKECCCPKVAYGIITPELNFIKNTGIAGVTSGATGVYEVQFEHNFFDKCDPNNTPIITVENVIINLDEGGLAGIAGNVLPIITEVNEFDSIGVITVDQNGDPTDNIVFSIQATQYPKCY